jgi:hypothetical protein
LLREGAQAEAVVTEHQVATLNEGGAATFKLVLEVHFPDGSRAELREKVRVTDIGYLGGRPGQVLPVRYDPDDRSDIALDMPAIIAAREEAEQQSNQEAIARGREMLGG